MHYLHMAATNKQYFFGPDIHAFRIDDANRNADWFAPTLSCSRLYQVQGGIAGRGVEGSCTDMGYLQCCRTAVSFTVAYHLGLQKLNIQRVATGYGQPPSTFYDWTLAPSGAHEPSFRLSDEVYGRLLIEKFSNKVTKALYSNRLDPVGLVSDNERSVHTTFLAREYQDLEQKLQLDGHCTCILLRPQFFAFVIVFFVSFRSHLLRYQPPKILTLWQSQQSTFAPPIFISISQPSSTPHLQMTTTSSSSHFGDRRPRSSKRPSTSTRPQAAYSFTLPITSSK